jgi:hypothetical protein
MFPRHQPDWRLFDVYSGYTNISLQSEEQRLYEARLLKTPAKIKEYLEQANSDNPKFPIGLCQTRSCKSPMIIGVLKWMPGKESF